MPRGANADAVGGKVVIELDHIDERHQFGWNLGPGKILLLAGMLVVLLLGIVYGASRQDDGLDDALADYLALRSDLGDDLSYRAVTDARREQVARGEVQACLATADVEFDWDTWGRPW